MADDLFKNVNKSVEVWFLYKRTLSIRFKVLFSLFPAGRDLFFVQLNIESKLGVNASATRFPPGIPGCLEHLQVLTWSQGAKTGGSF